MRHEGLRTLRMAALCREIGAHHPDALHSLAVLAAAVARGALDGSDLEAALASSEPQQAAAALASLPSARAAYTGARLRLRDGQRHATGA
jgi:hypothetical protein